MTKITGGSLEFEITANAGKLSDVLEETKRRVQGFTDATAAGGEDMENALKEQFGKEEAEEMMQQQVNRHQTRWNRSRQPTRKKIQTHSRLSKEEKGAKRPNYSPNNSKKNEKRTETAKRDRKRRTPRLSI